MFPNYPRRSPMGTRPMKRVPRQPYGDPFSFRGTSTQKHLYQQPSNIQAMLSMFRDEEGNMDIGKMIHTAEQLNGVYKQISPVITKFLNK